MPLASSDAPARGKARMIARPVLLFLIATLSASVSAEQQAPGDLSVERPWARALPPVAPNGAAYLRIANTGDAPDRIVSASSPIAERVEIHAHEMDGGVAKMRHVHSVEVPAHGAVSFEPGGLHLMLIGLKKPLVVGKRFALTLGFENAGELAVTVEITDRAMTDHSGHGGRKHGQTQ